MSCASPSLVAPHPRASVALRLERRGTSRLASSSSSPSGSVARLGVVASAGGRPRDRVVDRDALVAIQSAFERPAVPLKDGATVTLRPMRESDVRALTAVMVDAFRGTPDERPRARVAKYLLDQLDPDPEEICLVAVFDDAPDEPVAIASLSFSESARGGPARRRRKPRRPRRRTRRTCATWPSRTNTAAEASRKRSSPRVTSSRARWDTRTCGSTFDPPTSSPSGSTGRAGTTKRPGAGAEAGMGAVFAIFRS